MSGAKANDTAKQGVNFAKSSTNSAQNSVHLGQNSATTAQNANLIMQGANSATQNENLSAITQSVNSVQTAQSKNSRKGYVLLISGPSGAGKSTLLARLMGEFKDELYFSVSCTTRAPRNGEKNGVNYHFISEDDFKKGIEEGLFLEYAFVHSHYYGTRAKETEQALQQGKIVIFDIDVQGFHLVRGKLKDTLTSVFITSKSASELKNRLLSRASGDDIEKRLKNAQSEMKALCEYDYLIINEDLEQAYAQLKSIFMAQKLKLSCYNANEILNEWIKS